MSDPTRQKSTIFVGGLDNNVDQQTLHDAFIPFGEIVDINLPKPELYLIPFAISTCRLYADETDFLGRQTKIRTAGSPT